MSAAWMQERYFWDLSPMQPLFKLTKFTTVATLNSTNKKSWLSHHLKQESVSSVRMSAFVCIVVPHWFPCNPKSRLCFKAGICTAMHTKAFSPKTSISHMHSSYFNQHHKLFIIRLRCTTFKKISRNNFSTFQSGVGLSKIARSWLWCLIKTLSVFIFIAMDYLAPRIPSLYGQWLYIYTRYFNLDSQQSLE